MNKKTSLKLMTLVYGLSPTKLKHMKANLIDAGMVFEYKGDYRKLFKTMKGQSKGREKKIYSAISKFSNERCDHMFKELVEYKGHEA